MDYKEHYRRDAEEFDYFRSERLTTEEKRRTEYILDLCGIRKDMSILDIGSGRGWFSIAAARKEAQVTAMDLSETNLQRIHELEPQVRTVFGDAGAMPELDQKFDLIVLLEVLEHLVEPEKALQNCRALLNPGGVLLITVPYKETIRYSLCIHCNRKTPFDAHLHSFDRHKMKTILHQNGFRLTTSLLYFHKAMTLFRLTRFTRPLPFPAWKLLDRLLGFATDRYSFLAVKAVMR